jgi:hypothetical protein
MELGFEARHLTLVRLVIVPEQVQQSVQREDAKLGSKGVSGRARLAGRHA